MREAVLQASFAFAATFVLALPVLADDWLALLPACSMPAASSPALEVIYPEPSLPAVVAAADGLIARVRVPAALTPPPGVQQERALRGWSAELIGGGIVLGPAQLAHRHTLAIVAVRPDAGSSLVYRIRMLVPAYVAPGRYSLWLRTPFGERRVESAVFVTSRGAAWSGWPPLELKGRSLALRVGSELWVSAACSGDRTVFEADVRSLLAVERRVQVSLNTSPVPLMAAGLREPSELDGAGWTRTIDTLQANTAAPVERQVRLLLPAASRIDVSGGKLELYPASDLALHRITAISAVFTLAAGARGQVAISQALPRSQPLALEPRVTESGARTRLRVRGAEAAARVAYDYGFGRTAWAGPEHWAEFAGPLPQPLRALVLTPSHGGELLRQRLLVTARRPPNCSAVPLASHRGWPWAMLALGALLWLKQLLKKRRRLALGIDSAPAFVLPLDIPCDMPGRRAELASGDIPGRRAELASGDIPGRRVSHAQYHRFHLSPLVSAAVGAGCRLRAHADSEHARGRHGRKP